MNQAVVVVLVEQEGRKFVLRTSGARGWAAGRSPMRAIAVLNVLNECRDNHRAVRDAGLYHFFYVSKEAEVPFVRVDVCVEEEQKAQAEFQDDDV